MITNVFIIILASTVISNFTIITAAKYSSILIIGAYCSVILIQVTTIATKTRLSFHVLCVITLIPTIATSTMIKNTFTMIIANPVVISNSFTIFVDLFNFASNYQQKVTTTLIYLVLFILV